MKDVSLRILELSHRHKLSHVSSCLELASVLEPIYATEMKPTDICVLSAGHAGLALYCVLERYRGQDAEELLNLYGSQPHLDPSRGIHCSSGSLGQGLTMAAGYALADASRKVHCLITDGECAEGCVWEALTFARNHDLQNLVVHVCCNGHSALGPIDRGYLADRLRAFWPRVLVRDVNGALARYPFLQGVKGHYHVLNDGEFAASTIIDGGMI